jgi:acetyl esterase
MLPILERLRAAPAVNYAAMPIVAARGLFEQGAAPWRAMAPAVAHVEDLTIPGPAAPMRARLYRPSGGPVPLILFVHGGGWTFGSVDTHEVEMRHLALAAGAAVLGFNYRLAPEHPFPAGMDDVLAAFAFAESGGLGRDVDSTKITIAGDSAGANLALAAMIARRDDGLALPRAAAFFYGCFAPDFDTGSHRACGDGSFGISSERMRWYWRNFMGHDDFGVKSLAAPLRAELSGLPPIYLAAAGLDPLRDDTLALGRALAAAGVVHRIDATPGVIHGYLRFASELPAARATLDAAGAFLALHTKTRKPGGI